MKEKFLEKFIRFILEYFRSNKNDLGCFFYVVLALGFYCVLNYLFKEMQQPYGGLFK